MAGHEGKAELVTQAIAIERARRDEGQDPETARSLWKALIEGRWSLVERFEVDARRLLLVECGEAHSQSLPVLSERERRVVAFLRLSHSHKFIARELGYSEATVSRLARSALRKLGLRCRAELIEIHSVLVDSAAE